MQPCIATSNGISSTRAPDFALNARGHIAIFAHELTRKATRENAKGGRWFDLLKITSTVLAKY